MRTSALFVAKNLGFFELYGMSAGSRRLSQCGHFADKGEGLIFRDFVQTFLWTAPNYEKRCDLHKINWTGNII